MVVREVFYDPKFQKTFDKIKDSALKERVKKQIQKIIENPEVGKPLRYDLKGSRSVRVSPFRVIYAFTEGKIIILNFKHRKSVYD